ncbi:MAG: DNA polymerase III subunit alpha [Bacteroidetes bacterium]|nr:DNA polymerase III subunit alpha [Bacteroidota bacterium]
MFLIFDTETTGLPQRWDAPLDDFDNWPRLIQLAWQIHDDLGNLTEVKSFLIKPDGFIIPRGSEKVHGISTERATKEGHPIKFVLDEFIKALEESQTIIGHNIEFDNSIVGSEILRRGVLNPLPDINAVDTKIVSTNYCALPGGRGGNYKWPTLKELYFKLFNESFDAAHNASADVQATARCFFELIRLRLINAVELNINPALVEEFITNNPDVIKAVGIEVTPFHENEIKDTEVVIEEVITDQVSPIVEESIFTHLHVHTQFSVLDGLSNIDLMLDKAKLDGMEAVAITDHGYMYGVKKFHDAALRKGIKPILGCEVYVARRGMSIKEGKIDGSGWHLVLLAKNLLGYHNLIKMVSIASIDGFYYKPRVDKELLKEYSEGIIALSACLGGEVAQKIINEGEDKAEQAILEYKEIFGEDFYLELQRHPTGDPEMDKKVFDDQEYVNKALLSFSDKHGVKTVVTNDSHFINAEDAGAHDRLICIGTAKDLDDPNRMRYTQQEWFKTQDEMKKLFADVPLSIKNTEEVADKVEVYELNKEPIMPEFIIPEDFSDADDYLKHITYLGAEKRYPEITDEIRDRIDFELNTIKKMGFPDYFLIVWDFLVAARNMGVIIGPGRGSAAGSVVSYSLRITDIEPLRYNLLFERFLNPDRISMPDIDIDFDDDGRDKILAWVKEKYGDKRVAHLITFGTMAAKMAIRDVARVQRLHLSEADRLAKMVPESPGITLNRAMKENPELKYELENGKPEVSSVLKNALTLEGSIRNTGTHACGIIISKKDLHNYIPVTSVKDSVLTYATQIDGKYIESVGLLKMDFLGLKTLSIIKDTINNIKKSKGEIVDIDKISFEDKLTYELFSRGDTVALFQFESDGMRKHLKDLKPSRFEDLIAMVALYRPGPMEYIPNFINRKHGRENIEYDLPEMEEYLEETYGITVYQEQVMLLSRKLGGFTRGQSDSLRKAMGKKKIAEMEKMKVKFIEGCKANNLAVDKVDKIWKDWEAFARYAFNKSHATCYAYLAYQTAYLKAHYPAEFMAANLGRNLHDIKKITHLLAETKRMGIDVLRPDINESSASFTVTKDGIIRFGLAAIKGVGEAAVDQIIIEREKNNYYANIFNLAKRVSLKSVNKRSFEALAKAGAFDGFPDVHRAQYFYTEGDNSGVFIEKVIRHGSMYQEQQQSQQVSLFGDTEMFEVHDPQIPECEQWTLPVQLQFEKEVTGFYISGHPLNDFSQTMERYCKASIDEVRNNIVKFKDQQITFAGMITESLQKMSKNGDPFGTFTIEDFSGNINLVLFSESYLKKKHMLDVGNNIFITARIEERHYQPGSLQIKILDIYLLSETMEKLAKGITLDIIASDISDNISEEIIGLTKTYVGTTPLRLRLTDTEINMSINLKSGSAKVDARLFIKAISTAGKFRFSIQ